MLKELSDNYNGPRKKKNQSEMENTICEIMNTL